MRRFLSWTGLIAIVILLIPFSIWLSGRIDKYVAIDRYRHNADAFALVASHAESWPDVTRIELTRDGLNATDGPGDPLDFADLHDDDVRAALTKILRNLHFEMVLKDHEDVYFHFRSGFEYAFTIVVAKNGPPHYPSITELVPLGNGVYFCVLN